MGSANLGAQSSNAPLPGGAVANDSLTLAELAQSLKNYLVPIGSLLPFAGVDTPSGFLLCDGTAVSRTTYADLYTVLGGASSPYGQGDSSTTFNLPDLRGRLPIGAGTGSGGGTSGTGLPTGGTSLANRTRGSWGGDERLQGHTHTGTTGTESANHTHSGTTGTVSADHAHGVSTEQFGVWVVGINAGYGANFGVWADSGGNFGYRGAHAHSTGGISANHTHSFSTGGVSANHTHSFTSNNHNQSVGASQNMQPYIVLNYIIKAY